ncbi:MAG: ATP-binding protein [Jaaginema sp. PMC 1079.18]|nr:ATP-binding protein [Jaaginema sp. PMC 1080.18]MEC4851586.1 ATP-binding protein [Jaaginema sp. PMC 1079.18]MEC4864843.1 ATP-binding protein [Jaaginema sp. PMC 1078.18]
MQNEFSSELPIPRLSQECDRDLDLDSTLLELPLYEFTLDIHQPSSVLADAFTRYPLLPGAVLNREDEFIGAVSRRQFLEYFLIPHSLELFVHEPLYVLYSYVRPDILVLPGQMRILAAAQRVFQRASYLIPDPAIVQTTATTYKLLDFGQLNLAAWQIRGIESQVRYEHSQAQMIQSEKMASLGRLVDGLAHEILDPVGFVWGNLSHLESYSTSLIELLESYETLFSETPADIQELQEELEWEYVRDDFPKAVNSIATGAKRLKELALSLQNFCHVDDIYPKPADLHACLDGIILLLKSRLSRKIKIVKNYGSLPPVTCYIGKLSQVFMNISIEAVQTLLESAIRQEWQDRLHSHKAIATPSEPTITITTQIKSESEDRRFVSIEIADNGPGLSPELQQQLQDSLTLDLRSTKETSLALSYQIVTAKHGGKLKWRSQPGNGTAFEIILPLN